MSVCLLYNALFVRSLHFIILSFGNFVEFKFREFVTANTLLSVFGNHGCWIALQLHSFSHFKRDFLRWFLFANTTSDNREVGHLQHWCLNLWNITCMLNVSREFNFREFATRENYLLYSIGFYYSCALSLSCFSKCVICIQQLTCFCTNSFYYMSNFCQQSCKFVDYFQNSVAIVLVIAYTLCEWL
jgi:hypothetical protein